ncbi:MAG: bifunctional UDP-sugar hydrolase/5'-nucleotidase [Lysobacterales bacterium]
MKSTLYSHVIAFALLASGCASSPDQSLMTLTVIGSNDVHGELAARGGVGGLETFSGYVQRLREVRSGDGGAVVLIDAGDMWQGTLESNLTEGADVVAAFNAMGYDAAAVGNHEFDFGPEGKEAIARSASEDSRGALKRRAREANFPLLIANLTVAETGKSIGWDNILPSVLLEKNGVSIGVIGVLASRGLAGTIAANVADLRVAPLAATIEREARSLRQRGAQLVIVTAHAGGACERFDNPHNLSSCRPDSEIFQVARALPEGLVNQIIAGHVHQGLAHRVGGTIITSAYSNTRAFSRVDYQINTRGGTVESEVIYPPQPIRAGSTYEGQPIAPQPKVSAIASRARTAAQALRNQPIGVDLGAAFTLQQSPDSSLGNLFTQAMHESLDADIVLQNVVGGLRTALPAGPLTYGSLFKTFPFDNRVVKLSLSGAQLRQVAGSEARRGQRTVGISGVSVFISCESDGMTVKLQRNDGSVVQDSDQISVATSDYLALGGAQVLESVMPEGGFPIDFGAPLVRDIIIEWLADQPSPLMPAAFRNESTINWHRPAALDPSCVFQP